MSTRKGNLLIIDDEKLIVERVSMLLEDLADEVFTAYDGVEGFEVFQENNIDCIICDIKMPRLNGVELIKKIREVNKEVPFIFYTGHGSKELMMEVVKYGAFDFLDKPNLDHLEEVVERGLKLGVKGTSDLKDSSDFISEYQDMMKEFDEDDS